MGTLTGSPLVRSALTLRSAVALCALVLAAQGHAQAPTRAPAESARRTPIVRAVERVAPATVNITSSKRTERGRNPFSRIDPSVEDFFEQFMDPDAGRSDETLGTGTIIDPSGYVLTNEHVLSAESEIRVTLLDGREFVAELVGADPETDLAVLRIESEKPLPTAPLARGSDLMMGETVIAIGNPYGLKHTVTTGVLSAVNRSFRADGDEYHGFLQTDASINPGNSGGPLINLDGEVIGINTAIFREAQGIGFAIPVDRARRILDDLIRDGEVTPIWFGLRLEELTRSLRRAHGIQSEAGAVVRDVFAGSPADRAGLRRGDLIVQFDGSRVQSMRNFYEILRGVTQGDKVGMRIERSGKAQPLTLVAEVFSEKAAEQMAALMLGVTVEAPAEPGPRGGLRVTRVLPRSPAADVALEPGDLILAIDRQPIRDLVGFRDAISRLQGRTRTLLHVQRGTYSGSVALVVS